MRTDALCGQQDGGVATTRRRHRGREEREGLRVRIVDFGRGQVGAAVAAAGHQHPAVDEPRRRRVRARERQLIVESGDGSRRRIQQDGRAQHRAVNSASAGNQHRVAGESRRRVPAARLREHGRQRGRARGDVEDLDIAGDEPPTMPPATTTRPSLSAIAEWPVRANSNAPASVVVLDVGLYSRAAFVGTCVVAEAAEDAACGRQPARPLRRHAESHLRPRPQPRCRWAAVPGRAARRLLPRSRATTINDRTPMTARMLSSSRRAASRHRGTRPRGGSSPNNVCEVC